MNACIAFGGLDVIKINLNNGKVKFSNICIFKPCHAWTHLLYWYIVENIFQLGGHLPNTPNIINFSKLNFQLCW